MPELRLENSIVDDRYRVDRCLGRGSYAEIFLAYDNARGDEPIIIKALNTALQGTPDEELDRMLVENFQNEAIALDKVRHPHIIRRLGHGTAADLQGVPFHYLVLEYMPGGDLLSLCRNRPLGLDDALYYFQQVAEALTYAHSQQVIHRDIKPNNILLSEDHEVIKIADFGVAKMAHDDSAEITRVGTNIYAPPEHHPEIMGDDQDQKLTPSADVYSLAKTIYTAMTGRAPRQFSRQPITSLPDDLASEPWGTELLGVLKRATASRVTDRYHSIQAFWDDFARLSAYTTAAGVDDPEATVVRSRLKATSNVGRSAPQPNFRAITGAVYEGTRPQKARIVVELPQQAKDNGGRVKDGEGREALPISAAHRPPLNAPPRDSRAYVVPKEGTLAAAQSGVAEREAAVGKNAARLRTNKIPVSVGIESSFLDNLRGMMGKGWLRFIFYLFLAAAVIGAAVHTYYRYANQSRSLPVPLSSIWPNKEGSIVGASNVNLRNQPSRQADVIVWLPNGTRVRVLEESDGWKRVKVLEWIGPRPDNSSDEGWVDGRFVRVD